MAKGTIIKKGSVNIKERKYKNTNAELTRRLQAELESDLIRLFQSSLYCDVELVVDSSPILTHSCILKGRASRFYSVITTEFEVVCGNGFSSIIICNGSFTYIRKFVENIYTNIHTPEVEDCIIKYLRDLKTTLEKEKEIYRLTEDYSIKQSLTTPESDLFFTPKCSPSEIQKPIIQSSTSTAVIKKENDVTSYYKIVSVDDIQIENQAFEKELAEQDELFLSFKSIFSKGNNSNNNNSKPRSKPKPKPNSLPLSNLASSHIAKKTNNNNNIKKKYESNLYFNEERYRLPLWKPNPIKKDIKKIDESFENSLFNDLEENSTCLSPDMDLSVAGLDSGLENSSSCQPEASPRENTVSETSGVDLTEAALNDEIPHDEGKGLGSSASSEIGTWDGDHDVKINKMPSNGLPIENHLNDEEVARLNDEEVARLDAMEKNIKDCETFLDMERRACCCVEDAFADQEKEMILGDEGLNFSDDFMLKEELNKDVIHKNLINNDFNYILLEQEESLKSNGELNSIEIKTPPCSPRDKNSEKSKSENNSNLPSGNFFIDASSLLDEDEILSPPVSLINFKSLDSETKEDVSLDEDQKEKERRQGEMIFATSIPHFSKHEVEENELKERLRGGADDAPEILKDEAEQVVPSGEPVEIHSPDSLSVDCSLENFGKEIGKKLNADALPIVSGGVQPEDYSSPPSYSSSPHSRRRNELAPILSGGAEFVEEEKKVERKPSQNPGEAWVVNFSDPKPKKRLATTSSESEAEVEHSEERKIPMHKKVKELKEGKKLNKEEPPVQGLYPVEKSASLGYFIKFGKEEAPEKPEVKEKKKKNIFSMFIDMSDDSLPPEEAPEKKDEYSSDNTITSDNQEETMKKSFYMFIESESPVVKRKLSQKAFQKKEVPSPGSFRKCHKRTQSFSVDSSSSHSTDEKIKGSSQSLFDADLSSADNSLPYMDHGKKLPLPLSKSHSIAAVCDTKVTAWSEPKENVQSKESWLKTKDVQITYTERKNEELILKKDSTFIIDDEGKRYKRKDASHRLSNGFHLGTVEESSTPKSSFKSPKSEERDSGVVATEESDDSFVKLSDMDNFKNPYMDAKKKTSHNSRMSQSIPESSWIESKSLKTFEDTPMSRSTGVAKSASGSSFWCDVNTSKSLSRLFPNLSMSAGSNYGKKSSSPGGRQDTDPSDTQVSEVSELSSMQSSVEPSALEISTSETDVSTHLNGASRLGEDLLRMFLEEISPDVVVEVGGRRMKAHKCILSSRCQYFAAMLSGGWVESAGNVISLQGDALNERYAEVQIDPELYFENTLNILRHLTRAEQDRLGTRVNKSMWNTPPAVVNAYYSRNKNQIMFPAGILQPPFYHRYFPRSLNYGGIGVVIGHEITHGFDDKGRLFDQDGNLHKWWKEPAIQAFHERAQCLIDQYSKYTVTEVAMQIDGVNTQGENIADNGGIKQAFKAYEKWLQVHGDEDEVLPGLNATNLQLFFLNFAQIWCGTMRPEATRNKLKTAVHSPGKFRVIGTLSNSEDFARVFQCEPGSPMNPIKKCEVWFSYNAVHFALCHIYSGENRIPDSLNIIELATLADMLSLEGLKEVISHTLKVKYCHCFHSPCTGCTIGVLDCLPVAAAYGLDDLYRKCLKWITKYFVKVWPTKTFASLPKELLDKCYQHHVVHLTVDTVLETILNIDKVRGSLPSVRWAETVSRLVSKLHDAAVKYIADHFSSILTSDHFLALGKEAGWSISRLEDSLMEATERLPPEQACWSHARLHRILSVASNSDPPPEMSWSDDFVELLQCISSHVENSLIKQAPRAARSKAWRQMEPELRSRIQEAACLVLPDEVKSPTRRSASAKKEIGSVNVTSSSRITSRSLDIRQMKLAMTQQASRASTINRLQSLQPDKRLLNESRLNSLKPIVPVSVTKKAEATGSLRRNQSKSQVNGDGPNQPKKVTPSRFLEVKSRYLEPKSPQKTVTEKSAPPPNLRRNIRPLSSSDSSRNCSPAMRRAAVNGASSISPTKKPNGTSNRNHRDSIVSNDSTTTADSRKERSSLSTRSQTPSVKTLSRLAADENMSTDSLCTDSLYSEKEATTKGFKPKGKENVEDKKRGLAKSATGPIMPSKPRLNNFSPYKNLSTVNSAGTNKPTQNKRIINLTKSASESKVPPPRRITSGRVANSNQTRASPGKSSLASPRTSTSRTTQRNVAQRDSNLTNGNTVRRKNDVDSENNKRNLKDEGLKGPKIVSRSGTFLKDEPTILKKPQVDNVQDEL